MPGDGLPGDPPWEVEIGFGKGRYLIEQAAAHADRRFLGVEVVSKYFRLADQKARRLALDNVTVVRGEALYLLSTVLPKQIASVVHVYFPDPWPKTRHRKRRLFDPETVDLVIGLLRPEGELCFATDFLEYGREVVSILEGYPGLSLELLDEPWPDGARTHYESKYMVEGRPILRLRARLEGRAGLHPVGRGGVLVAAQS